MKNENENKITQSTISMLVYVGMCVRHFFPKTVVHSIEADRYIVIVGWKKEKQ